MLEEAHGGDAARVFAVLTGAVAQALMAYWPDLRRWPHTVPSRSAGLSNPVVPWWPAFLIWPVIFVSSLAFAAWHALPQNWDAPMARQIGWLAAGVFALNTLWEWLVPKVGMGWRSVVVICGEAALLGLILVFLVLGAPAMDSFEHGVIAAPFFLFAGWVTAAIGVNLSSVLRAKGVGVGTLTSIVILLSATIVAVMAASATASWAYACAAAWACAGIAAANLVRERNLVVAAAAGLSAVSIIASAALASPFYPSIQTASPTPGLKLEFVTTENLEIAYHAFGPSDGPVIIALHGFPDSAASWNDAGEALARKGYRVYAPYFRGFGPTRFRRDDTVRSGQLAALVKDTIDFADALGVERFSLLGGDWGARVAQGVSVVVPHRVERLVSLSGYQIAFAYDGAPAPDAGELPKLWYQFVLNMPMGRGVLERGASVFAARLARDWSPTWPQSLRDEAIAKISSSFKNPDFVPVVLSAYSYTGWMADPAYSALEAELAVGPAVDVVAVIAEGADDGLAIGAAADALKFPQLQRRVAIKGVGHWPHLEQPEQVAALFE